MNKARWLASFIGMTAVLLLAEGAFAAYSIAVVSGIEVDPRGPFPTAQDVTWAKSFLPAMYVEAAEGFVFGIIAIVGALALATGRRWASRVLLWTSAGLTIVAAIAIGMTPSHWNIQAVFVALCGLLWLALRRPGNGETPALLQRGPPGASEAAYPIAAIILSARWPRTLDGTAKHRAQAYGVGSGTRYGLWSTSTRIRVGGRTDR
ncbi:MAG TPA: hypothetical protein VEF92_00280 [Burkholderiales bacterium]|nr:hypothetical protein [Burkholderiales bacterium]HYA45966.1 hypothetical protein [Burkholderiales bacterium]